MYLKLLCIGVIILFGNLSLHGQESIVVNPEGNPFTNLSAAELVQQVLISDNSILIDTNSFIISESPNDQGDPQNRSWGYFERNNTNFPFENGIILSTGNAVDAEGPNDDDGFGLGPLDWLGDQDLETILNTTDGSTHPTFNATVFQFDFVPQGNLLKFDFVFGSEEYENDYECTNIYRDGFAFLIKGPGIPDDSGTDFGGTNLAAIPNSNNVAVNTGTIHIETNPDGTPFICGNEQVGVNFFPQYYISNSGDNNSGVVQFDGYTSILESQIALVPGETYTIKFVITDRGDTQLDSAVFIRGFATQSNIEIVDENDSNLDFTMCEGEAEILTAINLGDPFSGSETYEWQLNDVTITEETTSSIRVTEGGVYRVIVTDLGAIYEDTIEVTIIPEANAGTPGAITLCVSDDPVDLFTALEGNPDPGGVWFPTLNSNSGIFNPTTDPEGVYTYTVSAGGDCPDASSTVIVGLNSLPELTILNTSCQPDLTTYHISYTTDQETIISVSEGNLDPDNSIITDIPVNENIFITVAWENSPSCLITQEVNAPRCECPDNPIPIGLTLSLTNGSFSASNTIIASITASGDFVYSLDGGPTQESPIFENISPGLYEVTVTETNNCRSETQQIQVIGFPNFFTPNNDGMNDTWNVIAGETPPDMEIYIYDRYGKLITQVDPNGPGWDGTYNGIHQPATDYWFVAKFKDGSQEAYRKHFTLIR